MEGIGRLRRMGVLGRRVGGSLRLREALAANGLNRRAVGILTMSFMRMVSREWQPAFKEWRVFQSARLTWLRLWLDGCRKKTREKRKGRNWKAGRKAFVCLSDSLRNDRSREPQTLRSEPEL